jgi:hypothetical protein
MCCRGSASRSVRFSRSRIAFFAIMHISEFISNKVKYTKVFTLYTDLSIEECLKRIQGLAMPRQRFSSESRNVTIKSLSAKVYTFNVSLNRYSRGDEIPSAIAQGMIHQENNRQVLIKGEITFGNQNYVLYSVLATVGLIATIIGFIGGNVMVGAFFVLPAGATAVSYQFARMDCVQLEQYILDSLANRIGFSDTQPLE